MCESSNNHAFSSNRNHDQIGLIAVRLTAYNLKIERQLKYISLSFRLLFSATMRIYNNMLKIACPESVRILFLSRRVEM